MLVHDSLFLHFAHEGVEDLHWGKCLAERPVTSLRITSKLPYPAARKRVSCEAINALTGLTPLSEVWLQTCTHAMSLLSAGHLEPQQ